VIGDDVYPVLATAVAVIGTFTVLNLLLCFAIIRRLRAAEAAAIWTPREEDMPEPGTIVGPLSVTTVDGDRLTEHDLDGEDVLVGIVQAGCAPCGAFVDRVERGTVRLPLGAVLFVARSEVADPEPYVRRLRTHARVVITSVESPELRAFGSVPGFPTFLRLRDGAIAAADHRVERVLRPVGVTT
jgi:hypothetical protein